MYFLKSIEETAPIIHSGENLSWWRPIRGYEADIWLRICVGADEQLVELQGVQMLITASIAGQQGFMFLSIDEGNKTLLPEDVQSEWERAISEFDADTTLWDDALVQAVLKLVRQYAIPVKEDEGKRIVPLLKKQGCCSIPEYLDVRRPCCKNPFLQEIMLAKQCSFEYRLMSQMVFAVVEEKCCQIPESMSDPDGNDVMPPLVDQISYRINSLLGHDLNHGVVFPAICDGYTGVAVMTTPFTLEDLIDSLSKPMMEFSVSSEAVDKLFFTGSSLFYALHIAAYCLRKRIQTCQAVAKKLVGAKPLFRDSDHVYSFGVFLLKETSSEPLCRELAIQIGELRNFMSEIQR